MSQIIISETVKPQLNLAFEEYLVKNANKDTNILFLWQNDETVVIGRNQNPWTECDVENIKKDGINLVRRLTGGGAVFHDKGNLNFTFISKNTKTKIEENFNIIIDSLAKLGIKSKFTGKNDIVVGKKKISGNAFVVEGDVLCHHGTLLVDADLTRLSDYLKVSDLKLKSKGIKSVVSRVTNIKSINSDLTVSSVIKQLTEIFTKTSVLYVYTKSYDEESIMKTLTNFKNRYESWSWNYGSTPNFEVTFEDRFSWGEIQLNFNVNDSIITDVKVYTDCNAPQLAKMIECNMKNHKFDKNEILKTLRLINRVEMKDIHNLFKSKMF